MFMKTNEKKKTHRQGTKVKWKRLISFKILNGIRLKNNNTKKKQMGNEQKSKRLNDLGFVFLMNSCVIFAFICANYISFFF